MSSIEELIKTSDVSKIQGKVAEVIESLWTRRELQRREALVSTFFNELFKEMEDNVRPADKVPTE